MHFNFSDFLNEPMKNRFGRKVYSAIGAKKVKLSLLILLTHAHNKIYVRFFLLLLRSMRINSGCILSVYYESGMRKSFIVEWHQMALNRT